ncbi:unnamed protein product [Xylocopa violacea]|uniref:Uncharacterized protein n=1 Tax=Xylocopa violacea TaxID=135666 RepID=A0ABP1N4H7_XYLVO
MYAHGGVIFLVYKQSDGDLGNELTLENFRGFARPRCYVTPTFYFSLAQVAMVRCDSSRFSTRRQFPVCGTRNFFGKPNSNVYVNRENIFQSQCHENHLRSK